VVHNALLQTMLPEVIEETVGMDKQGNKLGLRSKNDTRPVGVKRTFITDLLAAFQRTDAPTLAPETLRAVAYYASDLQLRMGMLVTLTAVGNTPSGPWPGRADKFDPVQSLLQVGERCTTAFKPLGSGPHSMQDFVTCLSLLSEVERDMEVLEQGLASQLGTADMLLH
jgi:hypothetical protein